MNDSQRFQEPVLLDTTRVDEQKIYSFTRREIFSPQKNGNRGIKFCTVAGPHNAQSQSHTHPGDEIVITVSGENTNFLSGKQIILTANQGLCVPPGCKHTTTVTGIDGWSGLSFYCDDCALIKKNKNTKDTAPSKSLSEEISPVIKNNLPTKEMFSPGNKTSCFLEIQEIIIPQKGTSNKITMASESIYYCTKGEVFVCFFEHKVKLSEKKAIMIPPNTTHMIASGKNTAAALISASCNACPLILK